LELDPKYEPAKVNKRSIVSLSDGQKLADLKYGSIDYYKDYKMKKKSLYKTLFK